MKRLQQAESEADRSEPTEAIMAFGPDAQEAVPFLLEMLDDERVILTTLMPSLDHMKECMLNRSSRKLRMRQKLS